MNRKLVLILSDTLSYWLALFLTLVIRYGKSLNSSLILNHLIPFGILFLLALFIFYSFRLYEIYYGIRKTDWILPLVISLIIFFLIASAFFYFYSRFYNGITPRGNLILFLMIFAILVGIFRTLLEILVLGNLKEKIIIIGKSPDFLKLASFLQIHEEYGFKIIQLLSFVEIDRIKKLVWEEKVKIAILEEDLVKNSSTSEILEILNLNLNLETLDSFYENKLSKINLNSLSNIWLLTNLFKNKNGISQAIYSLFEKFWAAIFLIILSPVLILVSISILIFMGTPIIYKQQRVGKNNQVFTIYKFRTMTKDAEKTGAQWAVIGDKRVTPLGQILRKTHFDEFPQLINILQGKLSFVGPRPERPEFVEILQKEIPYYNLRHLVKPGITGWAQLNYPYASSIEDSFEKLQYDLFYLKHKGFLFDLSIILKTLRSFIQNPQKT